TRAGARGARSRGSVRTARAAATARGLRARAAGAPPGVEAVRAAGAARGAEAAAGRDHPTQQRGLLSSPRRGDRPADRLAGDGALGLVQQRPALIGAPLEEAFPIPGVGAAPGAVAAPRALLSLLLEPEAALAGQR